VSALLAFEGHHSTSSGVTVFRTEQLKKFAISAAVLALQSAQRVPHHDF
jgi:hypothetical protein